MKILHGEFPELSTGKSCGQSNLPMWPSRGYIYPETEGFAVAIQDRVIKTRNYEKHCLGVEVIDKCRKCDEMGETNEHIIAGISSLSESTYLRTDNQMAKIIHQHTAINYKLPDTITPLS
jgi:hypothetical protein